MKRSIKFYSIVGVLIILGAMLIGSLPVGSQAVLADESKKPEPYYPTLTPPPPPQPGEKMPQPKTEGVVYELSAGKTSFDIFGFAGNPSKSGSSVLGSSWQWTQYGDDPWDVAEMETITGLYWWDSSQSEWVLQSSDYTKKTDCWKCQADDSAFGCTGYWITTGRWLGEAYSGDSPPDWDFGGESDYVWLDF